MTRDAFGWTAQRQTDFADYEADGLLPGRITGEHRTHFRVATEVGEVTAEIQGRLRKSASLRSDLPGVGDFVALRLSISDGPAIIEAVLPRATALIRKAAGEARPQLLAANIDVIFIVMGLDGDFNLQRLERYLDLVRDSGSSAVIVANKIDLASDLTTAKREMMAVAPGIPLHTISARDRRSVSELESYFTRNRTVALIGSSGAGKSTLTNQLLGRDAQATQDVRVHDDRGRHTTTHRQMYFRDNGGAIIDTPGMRGLELWNEPQATLTSFDDIETLAGQCKFRNCQHMTEPACAVRAAVVRGKITAEHLSSYQRRPGSPKR